MDQFMYLQPIQRENIKNSLLQYIFYFNKQNKTISSDKTLDILNNFLKEIVQPFWFPWDNIFMIKDCYEYIAFINENIDNFEPNENCKLLFFTDVINEKEKVYIKNLMTHPIIEKIKSFPDSDIQYMHKDNYKLYATIMEKIILSNKNRES